ncbi:spore germination protein [Paenibacillus sp. CCS19]|nr:spore germination protein [Paenibacillus cellulosilyticus]
MVACMESKSLTRGFRKYRDATTRAEPARTEPIEVDLKHNFEKLKEIFSNTPDLINRHFILKADNRQAILAYLEGLSDKNSINRDILTPLKQGTAEINGDNDFPATIGEFHRLQDWGQVEHMLFAGYSILFIDGEQVAYACGSQGWPQRAIEDPQLETSLKGAHQGFVETGGANVALIRRYIPNRELKIKEFTIGARSQTKLSILYLADVANVQTLHVLEERLSQLDIDAVINTGELAELIEDSPLSPFPQFILTERPDAASSQILQGKFVIVVDRSPSALVGPVNFISFFQSVDDYSTRWTIATFIRMLRLLAFFIAILLPAIYIAVVSFHFEVIPMKLLSTIGQSRAKVPFPPYMEAVFMELTLEMLREAGVRLPAPVGQTVGIVGGIVIGQAIVQAGLISNIMVVVVAFTAISSFILPNYDMGAAVRLVRFAMMLFASIFGFVGIVVGLLTLIAHLLSLKSLGVPYSTPFGPVRFRDWKDTLVRIPIWLMKNRPTSSNAQQDTRQGDTGHPREDESH